MSVSIVHSVAIELDRRSTTGAEPLSTCALAPWNANIAPGIARTPRQIPSLDLPGCRHRAYRLRCQNIRKHKSISLNDFACLHAYGPVEHGPCIGKGVKLSSLTTWIHIARKFRQQLRIELATRKRHIQMMWVHTGQSRSQAAYNHLRRQLIGRQLPEGKERRKSGAAG